MVSPNGILGTRNPKIKNVESQNTRKLENQENYIIVKFQEEVYYPNGFGFITYDNSQNEYRTNISKIKYSENEKEKKSSEKLSKVTNLIIYFLSPIKSLSKFFYNYYDPNVELIVSVDLSHLDVSSLISVDGMFYGCSSLKSIDLTNFKAPSLKNMNKMFFHCSSLESIDLSSLESQSLLDTGCLFCGCSSLEYLDINGMNLANTKDSSNMFFNVKNLKYINLYNIQTTESFLKDITGEFGINNKDDLTVCQLSEIITNPNVNYICCKFDLIKKNCVFSKPIKIYYNKDLEYTKGFLYNKDNKENKGRKYKFSLKHNGRSYNFTEKLEIKKNKEVEIFFPFPITSLESFFDANYDNNVKNIVSIDLSDFDSTLISSIRKMFSGCSSLQSIVLSNFNTQSLVDMSYLFSGCSSLQSIDLSNFNKKSVKDMSYLFSGCSSLQSIVLSNSNSNFNTESVKNMSYLFSGCSSLKSIDLSKFNTNSVIDISGIFKGCSNLTSINLSNFKTSTVNNFNSMFLGCESLQSLILNNFETSSVTNMGSMFDGCGNLNLLDISNFNLNNIKDASNMFKGLKDSIYINLTNVKNYGNKQFQNELNTNNGLNSKIGIIICQNEGIVNNDKAKYICCDFDFKDGLCKSSNYILVYYKELTKYSYGFECNNKNGQNEIRKNINFINSNGSTYTIKNELIIEANSTVEIHFLSPQTSLERFFDIDIDENAGNIKSIDFKHFNKSLIKNMTSLFNGCKELIFLDISDFNMENIEIQNIFKNVSNLKYINLTNIQNFNKSKGESKSEISVLNKKKDLFVCQKDDIFSNENVKFICCDFNITIENCQHNNNYIEVSYSENISYSNGFQYYDNKSKIEERNDISYILKENEILGRNNAFYTGKNSTIKIYFPISSINLESFFDSKIDSNVNKINSIDIKLNSQIKTMKSMFNGCSRLVSINANDMNTLSVNDTSNLFNGCSSLEKFTATFLINNVVNFTSMFNGCSSLTSLNLNKFNIQQYPIFYQDIFKEVNNLQYLIINEIQGNVKEIFSSFNERPRLNVCQKQTDEPIITGVFNSCWGNTATTPSTQSETQKSEEENKVPYIKIKFDSNVNYQYGFIKNSQNQDNDKRKNKISNIKIKRNYDQDLIKGENDVLNFDANSYDSIEIYFKPSANINDLESFFDKLYDGNLENLTSVEIINFNYKIQSLKNLFKDCSSLKSVDFKNFTSSSVNDVSYMFSGCSSLQSIDLSSFETTLGINMDYMFNKCSKLISVNFANFNVTSMKGMFSECSNIVSVNFSKFNTGTLTNVDNLFYKCSNLKLVNFSNLSPKSSLNLANMIKEENKLEMLDISKSDFKNISISNGTGNSERNLFSDIKTLKYINLNNTQNYGNLHDKIKVLEDNHKNLIVCQNSKIIAKTDYDYFCCNYDIIESKCQNNNYIVVKYVSGNNINYNGFQNNNISRNDIYFIHINNNDKHPKNIFGISDAIIEIHFSFPIKSLNHFFDLEFDPNVGEITLINFTHFDSSCLENMNSLFKGCHNLNIIDFANFDTSKVTDMSNMFSDCNELNTIKIAKWSTSTVKNMAGMFNGCNDLETIDLSTFDTSKVTDMSKMFKGCKALKEIDLTTFNTPSLTNMREMFSSCQNIKKIDLYSFNTKLVTDMSYMFNECGELTQIDLSNFNTSLVTDMRYMFYKCGKLKFIDLYAFDMSSITSSANIFYNLYDLEYINLYKVKNGYNYISNTEINKKEGLYVCQNEDIITSKNIINKCCYYNISSSDCENTNYMILFFKEDVEYNSGFVKNINSRQTIKFIINGEHNNVKENNNFKIPAGKKVEIHFKTSITNLESFFNSNVDPNTMNIEYIDLFHFNSSKVDNMNYLFSGCSSLKSINFTNIKTSSVTNMSNMFYNCYSLKSIDFSNFDTSSVKNMSSMFYGCISLNGININNFNTSSVTDMNHMFYQCSSLDSLDITNFDTSTVFDMNSMFSGCSSLKSIDLYSFNTSLVRNMSSMFYGANALEIIDLGNFTTSSVYDMHNMFFECSGLKLLDLNYFNMEKVISAHDMFKKLEKLEYINIFNIENSYFNITETNLNKKDGLIVCQKHNVITNKKAINKCCYYNINGNGEDKCELTNYIILYYGKNITYNSGFITDTKTNKINTFRNNISFIINGEHYHKIENNQKLIIRKGTKIEIHFASNITSLESFFNHNYDSYVKNIEFISFGNFHSSSITQMDNLFFGCSSLKTVDFYNFNSSLVTKMNNLFSQCKSLESVNLSSFDTPKLENMESMFSGCISITSIDLTLFNTTLVTNMNSLFSDCQKLEVIELWNFDTTKVSQMSSMFLRCNSLKILDISYFNMINVKNGQNMFKDLISLKYIDIYNVINSGKNITNSYLKDIPNLTVCQKKKIIENEDRIEACCYLDKEAIKCDLSNYMIIYYGKDSEYKYGYEKYGNNKNNNYRKNKNIDYITYIEHDIKYSTTDELIIRKGSRIEIFFSKPVKSLKNFFNSYYDVNTKNIISIDLSHFDASLLTDMSSMFYGCESLKSIDFPVNKSSNLNNMNSLFYGCSSLESLDLEFFDTSLVTDMYSLFYKCSSLESIDFLKFNTTLVTDMNSMFYGCNSLKSIDLSYFHTPLVTDMSSMFYGCNSLQLIDLTYFDTSLTTDVRNMFYGCENLKYLDISHFNMKSIENSESMFDNLVNLKYINLYHVQNSGKNITDSYLNDIKKLTVCQKEAIITNKNVINECCYYNISSNKCESTNFIEIYYGKNVEYNSGFENKFRNSNNIEYIIGTDHNIKFSGKDKLDIRAGNKIEIYFSSPITSLENYFSSSYDKNMTNIISIHFCNFNSSLVTNMKSTFYGCNSLKSIDLYKIDTSSVTNMNSLFYDCRSLLSIDLSYFETSLVTDMSQMFYNCSSIDFLDLSYFNTSLVTDMSNMFKKCNALKYLDISRFNMKKIKNINSMFNEVNLKYINLYNVQNYHKDISQSYLKKIRNLTVCQREKIVLNEDAINQCCYFNMKSNKCEDTNYIIIYFEKDSEYNNGFIKEKAIRTDIKFIINEDHNIKIKDTDKLIIKAGKKIEVYFSKPIKSLKNYFSFSVDSNMNNIISIDFSHFNSSLVEEMDSMLYECSSLQSIDFSNFDTSSTKNMNSTFYGCNSLKSIDLSYFDTSLVTDMSNMFYKCSSIEIIDLSYFNTTLVTDMSNMFDGCNSLIFLDISRFNMEKVSKIDSMFNGVNLKYINLYDVENYHKDIDQSYLKDIKDLTVCQRDKIIKNKDLTNICCYYNVKTNKCENTNYIILFYGKNVENIYYFIKDENDKGKEIDYIINGNDHNLKLDGTDKLYLHRGSKIEIYYKSYVSSLENYFSSINDYNMANIASIYLSHFNSSLVTNMNSMFYECESLELADLSNLDTKSVESMNSMFYGCNSLKSIDLTYLNTSSITDMSKMFYSCSSIELIDLSNFNTSLVTDMTQMFDGCDSLIYLDISHFNMEKITNIESMFNKVNLTYINLYNVQNSYDNFTNSELNELTDLTVCQKEDIITKYKDNKCCYFNMITKKCENSNFIKIYYGRESNYFGGYINEYRKGEDIDYIISRNHYKKYSASDELFLSSGNKIEIYFKHPLESLENYFSVVYDLNMDNVISIDLSQFNSSLLTDMKMLFLGCNSLESVDFTYFKSSLVTNMNSMFFGCTSLKSIDLSYLDASSVLYMNYMFSECSSLESIDLSNFKTPSLINLNEMFYDCSSIKYIDLSNFVTSLVTNMNNMFSGCISLKYLDISHFNMEKVTKAVSMFGNVINLKYINLYKTQDANDLISNSELNNIDSLTVCQTDNILKKEDVINVCCAYDIEIDKCLYINSIIIYYGNDVDYNNGFKNKYRNNIDYIIKETNNTKISDSEPFTVEKNTKIEIHFKIPLKTLESFFDQQYDKNVKDLISIDLSYLDTSKITNLNAMFYNCSSLESIDFSYFNTSLVTDMEFLFENCFSLKSIDLSEFDTKLVTTTQSMFENCYSLESLNLSSFNTSLISQMGYMFSNCKSLKSLNISNFNTKLTTDIDYMFSGCTSLKVLDISNFTLHSRDLHDVFKDVSNLKYINIYNIEEEKAKISQTELNKLINLTVCQREKFLSKEDVINKCCHFYDIQRDFCETYDYIIVYYGDKESNFSKGFGYEETGSPINTRINAINYIILNDEKNEIGIEESLTIRPYSKIEIYIRSNATSLESLFDYVYDENADNIISIDLSHLDTSLITNFDSLFSGCKSLESVNLSNINTTLVNNMNSMFSGCNSLKSIDLTNLNTQSLTEMSSMFYGCTLLESIYLSNFNTSSITKMNSIFSGCNSLNSIDLSYFDTSLVTDMSNMFYDCQSLKVLDLMNFNMINVKNYQNMFDYAQNLQYINLYNAQDSQKILSKTQVQNVEKLKVCQKKVILSKKINKCCYYNITTSNCISENYIIVYYGEDAEYPDGFGNAFRKNISFIINEDYESPLISSSEFNINAGSKIKIYFNSTTDLESFFDINYDANVEKIVSIDFSQFDSSKITKINKIFSGCYSLKSIDFTNIYISSINNMNFLFFGCKELKSIDLSIFDTSLVTDMSYLFSGCSSLESIDFSHLNTTLVNNMNYMFYRCSSLKSVDLSKYKTSFLTNLDKLFYKCQNLNSINLTNFNTSSVINMNGMFYECDNLNYLDLANFNMKSCNSYENMFTNISNIKFINLHYADNDKIISNSFKETNHLFVCQIKKIITNPKAYNCCNYIFETDECVFIPIISSIINTQFDIQTNSFDTETSNNIITPNTDSTINSQENTNINEIESNDINTATSNLEPSNTLDIGNTVETTSEKTEEKPTNIIASSEKHSEVDISEKISSVVKEPTVENNTENKISISSVDDNTENSSTSDSPQTNTYSNNENTQEKTIKETTQKASSDETESSPSTSSENEKKENNENTNEINESQNPENEKKDNTENPKHQTGKVDNNESPNSQDEIIDNKDNTIDINESQNPHTVINLDGASAILLGFSQFKKQSFSISFHIHFSSVKGFIFSPILIFYVEIISKRLLRILENHEAYCIKNDNDENDDVKYASYTCTVQTIVKNIAQIKIIPNYNFTSQDVKIIGISPIATPFLDNLQNVSEEEIDFSKTLIYILDHSKVDKYVDNSIFNISGVIEESKPNLTYIDLILKINTLFENETKEVDTNCKIIDKNLNNYTLNCEGKENIKYDLQSAFSYMENGILIVNFDEDSNSEIIFASSNSYSKIDNTNKKKEGGGISTGAIVGIIIASLAVLATIAIIIIYVRRRKNRKINISETEIHNLDL